MLPPLVDYAGRRGVEIIIENCLMEQWHPDGYPGKLAYFPELYEWMYSLELYLNVNPSHLIWQVPAGRLGCMARYALRDRLADFRTATLPGSWRGYMITARINLITHPGVDT